MGLSLQVYDQTSAVSTSLDDSKLLCDLPLTSRSQMPALNVIIGAIDMVNAMDVNGNDEQKQKIRADRLVMIHQTRAGTGDGIRTERYVSSSKAKQSGNNIGPAESAAAMRSRSLCGSVAGRAAWLPCCLRRLSGGKADAPNRH